MKLIKLIFKILFFPITILLWLFGSTATAAPTYGESYFAALIAQKTGYQSEVTIDRFRIDLISKSHAIEVDWGYKMYEAIGQAMVYSKVTGKKPGIAILIATDRDQRTFDRISPYAKKLGIKVMAYHVDKQKGKIT